MRVSFHRASIEMFSDISDQTRDVDLSARALYLAALAAKRNDDFDNMAGMLQRFMDKHAGHHLTDDVLCELGWLDLSVTKDLDLAAAYFRAVDDHYQGSNANDNAVNWLVILSLERGHYVDALFWSGRLGQIIVSDRLTSKTAGRRQRVDELARRTQGRLYENVEFINRWSWGFWGDDNGPSEVVIGNVKADSRAHLAGLRKGQQIYAVNGESLTSVDELMIKLAQFGENSVVQLSIDGNTIPIRIADLGTR